MLITVSLKPSGLLGPPLRVCLYYPFLGRDPRRGRLLGALLGAANLRGPQPDDFLLAMRAVSGGQRWVDCGKHNPVTTQAIPNGGGIRGKRPKAEGRG